MDVNGRTQSIQRVLDALSSEPLRSIVRHWDDARRLRLLPAWEDIDQSAIKAVLPNIWAWKYHKGTNTFTGRFAGEKINEIFGKSMKNADMKEFFSDWDYDSIFRKRHRVVTEPCIAVGSGFVFIHAERYGRGERIILPLGTNGVDGDGVLWATTYEFTKLDPEVTEPDLKETVTFFPL